jgi:hypothetical protein
VAYLLFKYLTTAALIVAISEIAKRSGKIGALFTALPLVVVLTLIWLYIDRQPAQKIGDYAYYTFWYVIPTLPMFLVFPLLLTRIGFWPTLLACAALTAGLFFLFALGVRRFGIELM